MLHLGQYAQRLPLVIETMNNPFLTPVPSNVASKADVDTYNQEAWKLRRSDTAHAITLGEKALVLAKASKYAAGCAHANLVLGYCYTRLSSPKSALRHTKLALEQFLKLNDKEGELKALNTLGIIHGDSGNLPEALKTFLSLIALCNDLDDQKGAADALNNAGLVYLYMGDLATALEHHLQALERFRTINRPEGEVQAMLNIGVVNYELGRYTEALEYFTSAETLDKPTDDGTDALILTNLGRSHLKLGNFVQALDHTQKSLALFEQVGNRLGTSLALDDLGLTYAQMNQITEASDCFNRGLWIKRELGDKKGQAETCIHLGRLYTRQGQLELALDTLHEGLSCAQEANARTEVYKAHEALAEAYKQNRQFRESCSHLENYTSLKDKVFNEASDLRLQGLRVRFEVEQTEKEKEIFRLKNVELANLVETLNKQKEALQKASEDKSVLLEQLEKQAREDGLTGLYNRRFFDTRLEQEFTRSSRYNRPLSIMICDIDNFKDVNDSYSHQIGDKVLQRVADILQDKVRQIDTVARYGGEEFIILFPETAGEDAVKVSERIRQAVQTHPWTELAPDLKVTLSMGVAHDLSVPNYEKLVGLADAKLYEAKHNGKNQVRC